MTIDRERIQRFLASLRGNLQKLREIAGEGQEAFERDYRSHHAAMRLLQISIEDMVDIGNHVISRKMYRKPKDLVEGICYENHVGEPGHYSGSFVHWYNKTTDQHLRYGSVHYTGAFDDMTERLANPYKYYLPFTITFDDIPAAQYSQSEMELGGISEHLSSGASYEATCMLRVTERLDYLPAASETTRVE